MSETNANQPTPEERRKSLRVRKEVHLKCTILSAPGEDVLGQTRDVGMGGLLLSTQRQLPIGALMLLRAEMQRDRFAFTVHGRVTWTEPSATGGRYESGVCFMGVDAPQRKNILAVVGRQGKADEERRYYIRLRKELLTEYRARHGLLNLWHKAHTQDISTGGVLLEAKGTLAMTDLVTLRIHLDDMPQPLEREGAIVNLRPAKKFGGYASAGVLFLKKEGPEHKRWVAYLSQQLTAQVMGCTEPPPVIHAPPATQPASEQPASQDG